jgi:hypothetical protein
MTDLTIRHDGKKFMWDNKVYATEQEAEEKEKSYLKDDFEVVKLEEEGKYLLYTRRIVTEIVLEEGGQPL